MRRRGFALAELLVALVIAGIIGAALARMTISQARFIATQDGMMQARGSARAALNVMSEELRLVGDSGLVAATTDSIVVRVPFATGVACWNSFTATVVSLLPADSASFASAVPDGWSWRDSAGTWHFSEPVTVTTSGTFALCASASTPVAVLSAPGWAATVAYLSPRAVSATVGTPIALYQKIVYRFAASAAVPGRTALWRTAGGVREELVAPFDTSSKFTFLVGDSLGYSATVPAQLNTVRGLRVILKGESRETPQGRTQPVEFDLTTDLLFRNRG